MKTLFLIPLLFTLFAKAQVFELKSVNIDSLVNAKVKAAIVAASTSANRAISFVVIC